MSERTIQKDKDGFGPRIIRTLGSQALSGITHSGLSCGSLPSGNQASSIGQSPNNTELTQGTGLANENHHHLHPHHHQQQAQPQQQQEQQEQQQQEQQQQQQQQEGQQQHRPQQNDSERRRSSQPPASLPNQQFQQTPHQGVGNFGLANTGQSSTASTPLSSLTPTSYRVAQACDRCRSKKTRCDGKRPQCSQCAAVGFECKISDKLSRRAFPRGYTETLEERVRELEAENRRLVALCDLKEEQLRLVSKYSGNNASGAVPGFSVLPVEDKKGITSDNTTPEEEQILQQLSNSDGGNLRVSSTNLFLLNKKTGTLPLAIDSQSDFLLQSTDKLQRQQLGLHAEIVPTAQNERKLLDDKNQENGFSESFPFVKPPQNCISPNFASAGVELRQHLQGKRQLPKNPVATYNSQFTNLNDPTSISFEQDQAPGLSAVKALTSIASHEQSSQLAALVAISIPRTTEEILFVPQLLARIGQVHGFTSKQCLYTASVLASLKEILPRQTSQELEILGTKNLWEIDDVDTFLSSCLRLNLRGEQNGDGSGKQAVLTLDEIEELIGLFFEEWYSLIPIFDKCEFDNYWRKFKENVMTPDFFTSGETLFDRRHKSISYKIFACLLATVIQMGLVTKVKRFNWDRTHRYNNLMIYYDRAMSYIVTNPYFSSNSTSIQSLQLLSLLLFYFLNVGDISSIYELRGKVVSLAQQLRLHRCPSAVLGGDGSTVSKEQQGQRRVLFWGVYYLDVFSSLQLGVPRLLKDYEIECALPVASDDDRQVNLAGQMISLEGKMSPFSLCIIRFSKVLGNVLDSIFKRGMTAAMTKEVSLVHENALDNWRHALPKDLRFHLDVNGTINMDEFNQLKHDYLNNNNINLKKENFIFMILYFLAKSMIHIPVVATKPLVDSSSTSSNSTASNAADRSSSSYILLQQATNTFLNVLTSMKSVYLPLPINLSRTKTRFGLFSARGSLEYTKGGALFQDNKSLLLDLVKEIEADRKLGLPGTVSWRSLKLLDMAVSLILQPLHTKPEKQEKMLQKKINYYNRMVNQTVTLSSTSSSQPEFRQRRSAPLQQVSKPNRQESKKQHVNQDSLSEHEQPNVQLPKRKSVDEGPGSARHPTEKKVKLESSLTSIPPIEHPLSSIEEDSKSLPKPLDGTTMIDNSTIRSKVDTSQPVGVNASNSITEAFQLDPVLQAMPFSTTNLTALFNSDYSNPASNFVDNQGSGVENNDVNGAYGLSRNSLLNFSNIGLGIGSGTTMTNINTADGLFKVPSNGDFLKDYYDGISSSNLTSLFINGNTSNLVPKSTAPQKYQSADTEVSGGRNEGRKQSSMQESGNPDDEMGNIGPNQTENRTKSDQKRQQGYGFVVDASLGLAPLLAWSPKTNSSDAAILDVASKEPIESKLNNNRSFTNVNKLDVIPTLMSTSASNPSDATFYQTQVATAVSANNRSASISMRKQLATNSGSPGGYLLNSELIQEDGILCIGRRSPRGPRRHWNGVGANEPQFQSNPTQPPQQSQLDDNIGDLFRWQNSS